MADGQQNSVLSQFVEELNAGRIRVVDLTTPLGPETPVIDLPPIFAPSPGLTLTEISRYDERGPAWYWNILHLGEHTGTHFDAPIHWVTGKDLPDNATDTIPPRRFIGPACVIDVTADVEQNLDFLLTPERVQQWEAQHGRIPAGAWVLLRTGWSARTSREDFLNVKEDGAHSPASPKSAPSSLPASATCWAWASRPSGRTPGRPEAFDPPFPNHTTMHGAGKFGITSLINLDQLPPTGAVVIAAPLKIVGGSGSPLRVLALTPA